jgi:hypothetical protein
MPLLIIAFALLLFPLMLPPLLLLLNIEALHVELTHVGMAATLAIGYGISLLVAWWAMNALGVRPFVDRLPRGKRLMQIGLAAYLVHFLLSLFSLPDLRLDSFSRGATQLPLLAARACLLAGLLVALCVELPRAISAAPLRHMAKAGRARATPVLTLTLWFFLLELFPIWTFAPDAGRYVFAFTYALLLLAAWLILRRLGIPTYEAQLMHGHRLMKIGLALLGLYLLLAAAGFILSAIPYGGGKVPESLVWLAVGAKLPLFAGLARAMGKESLQDRMAARAPTA